MISIGHADDVCLFVCAVSLWHMQTGNVPIGFFTIRDWSSCSFCICLAACHLYKVMSSVKHGAFLYIEIYRKPYNAKKYICALSGNCDNAGVLSLSNNFLSGDRPVLPGLTYNERRPTLARRLRCLSHGASQSIKTFNHKENSFRYVILFKTLCMLQNLNRSQRWVDGG